MSHSSKGSNIAKDVDQGQPSRDEGDGYKDGDSKQKQLSSQDQKHQQFSSGNNPRQPMKLIEGSSNKSEVQISSTEQADTAHPERHAQTQDSSENKETPAATPIVLHKRPQPPQPSEPSSGGGCSCCSIL